MKSISKIIQSQSDSRIYKCIDLSNKLKCLLISDSLTDKSAATMSVGVGSMEDPRDFPGLAHFLEHMLFLGTSKYPDQSEYKSYLMKNSGTMNAYTSSMETVYYFTVANHAFYGALDRFSQFFINPLFTESCTEREMEAVHSEHQKNLTTDGWRLLQLIRSSAFSNNPYNRFSTGNLETLKKPNIRENLLEFHKKYYSANVMSLVLYGNEEIDVLEKWAHELFDQINNYDLKEVKYTEKPFGKENCGNVFKVIPISNEDILKIIWYIDWLKPFYENNPGSYLSHIIGHEGEYSLLSLLIDEGLAYELSAGANDEINLFSKFEIGIKLTKKGLENYRDVCEFVFKFLKMMKEKGPQEYLFKEKQYINKLKFDFKDKERPENYVIPLANSLKSYPIEHILNHDYLMNNFEPEFLQKLTNSLELENMRIFLISKSVQSDVNEIEPIYQTHYNLSKLDNDLIERFKNPKIVPSISKKKIDLPSENYFLPRKFEILNSESCERPTKLLHTENSIIFYQQTPIFNIPKASIYCRILLKNDGFPHDPLYFVISKIWKELLYNHLRETIYQAHMANLNCSIFMHGLGIDLNFKGFSDGLIEFVQAILIKTNEFKLEKSDIEKFNNILHEIQLDFLNFYKSQPYSMANHYQKIFLKKGPIFDIDVLYENSKKVDFEIFLELTKNWFKYISFEWFGIGNLESSKLKEVCEFCVEKIGGSILPISEMTQIKTVKLPLESIYFYEYVIKNEKNQNNSALIMTFQNPNEISKREDSLIISLLINILKEPFFTKLRTEEQLGYIVSCNNVDDRGVFSVCFTIQSERKSSHYLAQRIEEFLKNNKEKILGIDDHNFNTYKQSVLVKIKEKDVNLFQVGSRFWDEIVKHYFQFDKQQADIKFIEELKKEEFVEFAKNILWEKCKRMEVHVTCQGHEKENLEIKKERIEKNGNIKEVFNYEEFRNEMKEFPDYYSYIKN